MQNQCPKCKAANPAAAYFCSNCGQVLKSKPSDTSIPKQILIYLVSFLFAPFGLGYAFIYLKQPDRKSKIIGWVSVALTVISIVLVIALAQGFLSQYSRMLNSIGSGGY